MSDSTAKRGHYYLYQQSDWVRPDHYPAGPEPDRALFRPVGAWVGRLILPDASARASGIGFEIHVAPDDHRQLIGQIVTLSWSDDLAVQARRTHSTIDVAFTETAKTKAAEGFLVLPERLDGWKAVDPLESIAGAHPTDDVIVRLDDPVDVVQGTDDNPATSLLITREPVRVTGRYYALVTFVSPAPDGGEVYRVRHFDRQTGAFNGPEAVVRLPAALPNSEGIAMSVSEGLERSPLNPVGWYIHGALDRDGDFVVQALVPRALVRLQPDRVIHGEAAAWHYIRHEAWHNPSEQKGRVASILATSATDDDAAAIAAWKAGDRAILAHIYSGIGGNKREAATKYGLYFGHFSFGIAHVVHEPLAGELSFDIVYYQVYASNVDGIIPGANSWTHYMGDRQFGWAGIRPICDIALKLDILDQPVVVGDDSWNGIDQVIDALEAMAARYRVADGHGATYVGIANNCAQDSGQALYSALDSARAHREAITGLEQARSADPALAERLDELQSLAQDLRAHLAGAETRRADWRESQATLGLDAGFFTQLTRGLATWRMLLPRKASDTVTRIFLHHGASAWVLRTNQIGGDDPDIEPISPLTI